MTKRHANECVPCGKYQVGCEMTFFPLKIETVRQEIFETRIAMRVGLRARANFGPTTATFGRSLR